MLLALCHAHRMQHRANHPDPGGLAEAELDGSIRGALGSRGHGGGWMGACLGRPETTDDIGGGLI